MPENIARERWDRLKVELIEFQAKEDEAWGGINDELLARYISGDCNFEEVSSVEVAVSRHPAVRAAIEIVTQTINSPVDQSASPVPIQANEPKELRAEVRLRPTNSIPMSAIKTDIDPQIPSNQISKSPLNDVTVLKDSTNIRQQLRRWRAFAISSIALFLIALFGQHLLNLSLRKELNRLASQIAARADGTPLIPTSAGLPRPINWATLLAQHYDAKASDDENLARLEGLGGSDVRDTIRLLRKEQPNAAAKAILQALFRIWGEPVPE